MFTCILSFRNGHLMTHRDKKPYQCMVTGCEKSYCDARSLKRHLENHHQHTSDQIAVEMVTAASQAADILAEVSAAQPITHKSPLSSQTMTTAILQATPSDSVIQAAPSVGQVQTQIPQSSLGVVATEKNVLAEQLMITPTVNQAGATLVTLAVTGQVNINSNSHQHLGQGQYEALLDHQIQIDPKDLEAIKVSVNAFFNAD